MNYPSIRVEGAILSSDLLDRLDDAKGQGPADFGLDPAIKVKDEIARAWADAQDYWRIFQRKTAADESTTLTTDTRNLWMTPLLGLLGYQLEYQPRGEALEGRNYAISHRAVNRGNTPVHIIGYREPAGLDRKPESRARTSDHRPLDATTASTRMSAHGMLQEYLNLTEQLYGLVSNGRVLRLLRDSSRLVKLSYLEFDLDRIFTDGLFADFAVLYRLLHATRLPEPGKGASACWFETYHQDGIEQGTRIREGLRRAVTEALEILGTGFLAHPDNANLRAQVASGAINAEAYFNVLLRLVYRLLFLMVIEERGLVFAAGTPSRKRDLYVAHYSVQRLRRLAVTRGLRIERVHDAWLALLAGFQLFEAPDKAALAGTTALGGQLFSPTSLGPLPDCRLGNATLFKALDRLCNFDDPETGQRVPVNFGALATEEFGSVYESLLELHPLIATTPTPSFGFKTAAGNERKTSGSYYTPSSLVDCLLDSALDPVLDARIRDFARLGYKTVDEAVLALKVCDPAVGSGHFLIAAAQRIARRLAVIRAGDGEPGPELLRRTLREVIGHCMFGVDINPMSVELCKLGLWLEAVEPGKPLTFLDHHIKCGNSLLGATPAAIRAGIPDEAYEPINGDTKEAARSMKKLNQAARAGQGAFDFSQAQPWDRLGNLPAAMATLDTLDDDTAEALGKKERLYREIVEGSGYDNARLLHDTWCAAFVWPKKSTALGAELTTAHLRDIERNPYSVSASLKDQIRGLARQYRFFHWHLEFPTVFDADGTGGFDGVLGNPPWEMMESEDGAIAPEEFARLQFCYKSNQYKVLNGRRDLYKLFLVSSAACTRLDGRLGFLIPLGAFIEDDSTELRKTLFDKGSVVELRHFQNHKRWFFPKVHASYRFCALTYSPNQHFSHSFSTVAMGSEDSFSNPFDVRVPRGEYDVWLGPERSATIYPSEPYARLHRAISNCLRSVKHVDFDVVAEFHASADKEQIVSVRSGNDWALLKNRNIHFFDHHYADHEAWIQPHHVKARLLRKGLAGEEWFSRFPRLVFRDIARNDDERTLIACLAPPGTVSSYDTPMFCPRCKVSMYPASIAFACATLTAFLFDFMIRPIVDKHIKGYTLARVGWPGIEGLPRRGLQLQWFVSRILELVYSGPEFEPFAQDCGWSGPPFRWDEERRFLLRCELDAAFFHLYLPAEADGAWQKAERETEEDLARLKASFRTPRDAVAYIMDTFPIIRRKDEEKHNGDYRTKRVILEIYDVMQAAIRTGQPYQTRLDPPPADPRCCHPPRSVA